MSSWGTQYSSGDQGTNRKKFWRSGYSLCPQCSATKFSNTKDCAGCRHNGDGYGTEIYECLNCHWTTSFQYDESGDSYFYETRNWSQTEEEPAQEIPPNVREFCVLTQEMRTRYTIMARNCPKEALQQAMRIGGYSEVDIDSILSTVVPPSQPYKYACDL